MRIDVSLVDLNGAKRRFTETVSRLKLLKHATFAGLGPNFAFVPMVANSIGVALQFGSKFSVDSDHISRTWSIKDPDDLRSMSRLIGRAIGDIFSKSHFGARFSLCYEHALVTNGLAAIGKSPDFYCIESSGTKAFTVEAKGFSQRTIGPKQFANHKAQSSASQLPINYSVASVTYNIYRRIAARVEDPEFDSRPLDPLFCQSLIEGYFHAIHRRLSSCCDKPIDLRIKDQEYFEYDASMHFIENSQSEFKVHFLVPRAPSISQRKVEITNERTLYIDSDGIGVRLSR